MQDPNFHRECIVVFLEPLICIPSLRFFGKKYGGIVIFNGQVKETQISRPEISDAKYFTPVIQDQMFIDPGRMMGRNIMIKGSLVEKIQHSFSSISWFPQLLYQVPLGNQKQCIQTNLSQISFFVIGTLESLLPQNSGFRYATMELQSSQ